MEEICGRSAISLVMRVLMSMILAPENEHVSALGMETWRTIEDPTTSMEGAGGLVDGPLGPEVTAL